MNLRELILAGAARLVKLPVAEWGVDVYLARMTLAEKLALSQRVGELEGIPEDDREARSRWMVRYVIAVALDETGKPIFSPEDEAGLFERSSATAIETVALSALRLNTLRRVDLDDLGKGFAPVQNGASPSGSPATSG